MTGVIGWYIHHHGGGHLARMRAVRPHLSTPVVCFSSLPPPVDLPADTDWVLLPQDNGVEDGRQPADADPSAGGLLHWAPLGHRGHRSRLAAIAEAAVQRGLDALVVDVSVEVAVFGRLLGLPVVLFAQPGARDDDPHALGYRAATRIVAPWPRALLRPRHLEALAAKTVYTGGISRFEGREPHPRSSTVLMLAGQGGSSVTDQQLADAEDATDAPWLVLGRGQWRSDPWPAIAAADVVVSWAGQNAVADLGVAGAHSLVIPQERPFDEQRATGAALTAAGLAIVQPVWPAAELWPEMLERARALRPEWSRWGTDGAAARAAAAIEAVL